MEIAESSIDLAELSILYASGYLRITYQSSRAFTAAPAGQLCTDLAVDLVD